jgi:hypothetical protein
MPENGMPKSMQKFATFQKVQKIRKIGPRCDFDLKRVPEVSAGCMVSGARGPSRRRPLTRMRQKKRRGQQKERRNKKERNGT